MNQKQRHTTSRAEVVYLCAANSSSRLPACACCWICSSASDLMRLEHDSVGVDVVEIHKTCEAKREAYVELR